MAQAPQGTFQLSQQHYEREIHNSESKQGLSDLQLYILFMALSNVFFPPLTLCLGDINTWEILVPELLLARYRGVLKILNLGENTMFSPAQLGVSGITPHLFGSFNPNSYLQFVFIHISNVLSLNSYLTLKSGHLQVPYLFASVKQRMGAVRPTRICKEAVTT